MLECGDPNRELVDARISHTSNFFTSATPRRKTMRDTGLDTSDLTDLNKEYKEQRCEDIAVTKDADGGVDGKEKSSIVIWSHLLLSGGW